MAAQDHTVLVVDDKEAVRRFVRAALESAGYTVLEAEDGRKALVLCEEHKGVIDLVVTDVVMPHLGGLELGEALHKISPEIRILYTSGYLHDTSPSGIVSSIGAFLPKPYSIAELHAKVGELIP
jgi:two-component system cell cycle sensor histidine kinase/response regulator CckA